jgi:hypothetical protein
MVGYYASCLTIGMCPRKFFQSERLGNCLFRGIALLGRVRIWLKGEELLHIRMSDPLCAITQHIIEMKSNKWPQTIFWTHLGRGCRCTRAGKQRTCGGTATLRARQMRGHWRPTACWPGCTRPQNGVRLMCETQAGLNAAPECQFL